MMFRRLDTNRDTKVSREEWIARYGSDAGFVEYTNGEEFIDADQYMATQMIKARYRMLDTNHDGKISREEWMAKYGTDKGFNAYDLNGDGLIDPEEFLASAPMRARPIPWHSRCRAEGPFHVQAWDGIPAQRMVPAEYGTPACRSPPRKGPREDLNSYEATADAMARIHHQRSQGEALRTAPAPFRSWESKRYVGDGGGWRVAAASQGGQRLFGAPSATAEEAAAYRGGYSPYVASPPPSYRSSNVSRAKATDYNHVAPQWETVHAMAESNAAKHMVEYGKMSEWAHYTRGVRKPNAVRYRAAGNPHAPF